MATGKKVNFTPCASNDVEQYKNDTSVSSICQRGIITDFPHKEIPIASQLKAEISGQTMANLVPGVLSYWDRVEEDPGNEVERWQHVNAIYRNIVGRNILRAFGHRVAMCCDMLGVVGSNLTIFKLEPTTPKVS